MQIAIIGLGGVTQAFRQWPERVLGERLVGLGHHVVAYGYHDPASPHLREQTEEIAGIQVRRLPRRFWPSRELRRAMASEVVPDVAHLFHPRNVLAFPSVRLLRRWRVPLVYTWLGPFHDPFLVDDRESPYEKPPHYDRLIYTLPQLLRRVRQGGNPREHLRNYLLHWPLTQVDIYLACSQHEAEELARMGLPAERIRVVPLWIETDVIDSLANRPPEHAFPEPFFLYIGQLTRRKGADLLIEAMPAVLNHYPHASFVFVTHNPAGQAELQARAESLGVVGQLHWLGEVSEEEKFALLRACSAYVLPTRYEGFGLPLLEAMAAGAPLVSSDIPVVREIVQDGENGLLVPLGDHDSLATALVRLVDEPDLRHRLVAAGERTVRERYNGAVLAQRVLAVYREAIEVVRKMGRAYG